MGGANGGVYVSGGGNLIGLDDEVRRVGHSVCARLHTIRGKLETFFVCVCVYVCMWVCVFVCVFVRAQDRIQSELRRVFFS